MTKLVFSRIIFFTLLIILTFGVGPHTLTTSICIAFGGICAFTYLMRENVSQLLWIIFFGMVSDVIIGTFYGVHIIFYMLCSFSFLTIIIKFSSLYNIRVGYLVMYVIIVATLMTMVYEYAFANVRLFLDQPYIFIENGFIASISFLFFFQYAQWIERVTGNVLSAENSKRHL